MTSAGTGLSNRLPYEQWPGHDERWMHDGRRDVTRHMMMQGSRSAAAPALVGRSLYIVRDAIDVVARRVAMLPSSPARAQLEVLLEECRSAVDGWDRAPPTAVERDRVMNRVLHLHTMMSRATSA